MSTVSYFETLPIILVSASNAQVYSRVLVQKTATQLFEYNHDDLSSLYTKPVIDLRLAEKNWKWLTNGMSDAELADFNIAKENLEHYDKLYTLIEYASKLNEGITVLEKRI